MTVYILWALYQDSVEEYVEPLVVVDDMTYEENPTYMKEKIADLREDASYVAFRIFKHGISGPDFKRITEILSTDAASTDDNMTTEVVE